MIEQSVNTDFVWVEEVSGDLARRRNRVVRVSGDGQAPVDEERYRSVFVSDGTLPRYWLSHRGVESASGIRGFDGPCSILEVPIDIDRETDGKADWGRAIGDARQFLHFLDLLYGVDLEVVRCSLTGGRGVHIRLPAGLFGDFEPSEAVPGVVRAVVESLSEEAGITVDLSIYDRNRVLRVPNSRHASGRYCVPVYATELLNEEIPHLVELMNSPRPEVTWAGEVAPVEGLVELRRACEEHVAGKAERKASFVEPSEEREAEILRYLEEQDIEFSSCGSDFVLRCPSAGHEDNEPSFHLDRQAGIYHCFGCDAKGNWEDFKRLISGESPEETVSDEYKEAAREIFAIRQKQGGQDHRKDFEIHSKVTERILSHLHRDGQFYTDGHRAYFFFKTDKRLIEISGEEDGFRLLLHRYGINPTETVFRWILEALRNEALEKGRRTEIHRLCYYDPHRYIVYLYNHKNQVYRISCDQIDLVDNGTDGVLFLADSRAEPFEHVLISGEQSRLNSVITSKINFAQDTLTAGERQRIFELWFYSVFFESIMPTKPIAAFIGPKGSGKSITLRKTGMLLFGKRFDVTPLSNDPKDFDAAVTNSPFVAFDNADHKCAWLNDRLATVATGGLIKKRELYTTNRLVEIPTRCFVGITAHTPQFRRDDVADRLLIMRVERFKAFVSEKVLQSEVLASRNEIMSEVILKLQKIVRALRAEEGVDDSSTFRMADFADFAVKVARHEGWEEQLKSIFGKLSHEQSEFTLEGDPIYETLCIWAPDNPEREATYKELWNELKDVAEQEGIDFREYQNNSRGFVRRMPNIRSNLEEFFEIRSFSKGGRVTKHTFKLKGGE